MGGRTRPRLLLLIPTTTYRAGAFMAAAESLGIDLTVASEQDSAFSAEEPDKLLTLPFGNPERAAQLIRQFDSRHPVSAVFGIDDRTAIVAAHGAAALGLPHNDIPAAEAAGNKFRQRTIMARAGVPVPPFERHLFSRLEGPVPRAVPFPAVLKPVTLSASRGVIRVNDPEECAAGLERLRHILAQASPRGPGEFLVESYVPGPEFALEGTLVDGVLHSLALFDKPDPLTGPHFAETIYLTPSRASPAVRQALSDTAQQACRALGLTRGPVHIELRHNARGPWLIELAARPIGGRCGQVLRFGENGSQSLETVLLGQALGRWHQPPAREQGASGVMMIPVPRAGEFRELRGLADARAVPGITDVKVTVHPGARVRPLPEESRYLGFVFARAGDPAEVERAIRAGWSLLEVVIV